MSDFEKAQYELAKLNDFVYQKIIELADGDEDKIAMYMMAFIIVTCRGFTRNKDDSDVAEFYIQLAYKDKQLREKTK